jgi:hypothetical protein
LRTNPARWAHPDPHRHLEQPAAVDFAGEPDQDRQVHPALALSLQPTVHGGGAKAHLRRNVVRESALDPQRALERII